jgi:uncharacterized protein (DUF1501 family)
MLTRRELLTRSAMISMAPLVPEFLNRTAEAAVADKDGRILVVVQLDGGNDGINTVVPYQDAEYARCRKQLRIATDRVCKLSGGVGLHPSMKRMAEMVEDGRLAVVQGVGYPNQDRSHFSSMAVWQTGVLDREGYGWLGKTLDRGTRAGAGAGPGAVYVGDRSLPRALQGRRTVTTSFADASDLALTLPAVAPADGGRPQGEDLAAFVGRTVTNAYATAAELSAAAERGRDGSASYPANALGKQMELVSRSIKAGASARVYYVIQPGYDTHAVQLPAQAELLGELSRSVRAFLDDLASSKLADRVVLLAFSEFGRRPAENDSLGTDHGTAGPVFVAGRGVKSGLVGATPKLGELVDGDLKWSIDFRQVYASLIDGWLGVDSKAVLGERFESLPILKI